MEDKWPSEVLDRPVFDYAWRLSHGWDWFVVGWWLCALGICVAFWVLLGLTLSGIG